MVNPKVEGDGEGKGNGDKGKRNSSAAPGSDDNIIYDVQPLRSIVPQNEKDVVIMNLKLHRQRLENANHEADPSSLCSSKSTLDQTAGKGNW
nr:hypothetical protein Iba_chr06bCG11280 [Ipomoea batatas]